MPAIGCPVDTGPRAVVDVIFELVLRGWRVHKALFGLLLAVFCSFVSAQAGSQWKIIHAGSLLADAREEVRAEQSIIIRNNVIVDVRDGYVAPGESAVQRMRR